MYVSVATWETIKTAKTETVKIITVASTKTPPEAQGAELIKNIFEIVTSLNKQPSEFAILTLKKEMNQLL